MPTETEKAEAMTDHVFAKAVREMMEQDTNEHALEEVTALVETVDKLCGGEDDSEQRATEFEHDNNEGTGNIGGTELPQTS
jgi:predicted ATPase